MRFSTVALMLVFCVAADASNAIPSDHKMRLCGMKLITALEQICEHRYAFRPNIPMTGGLAYECCVNRCSWNFLKNFCEEPTKAKPMERSFLRRR